MYIAGQIVNQTRSIRSERLSPDVSRSAQKQFVLTGAISRCQVKTNPSTVGSEYHSFAIWCPDRTEGKSCVESQAAGSTANQINDPDVPTTTLNDPGHQTLTVG